MFYAGLVLVAVYRLLLVINMLWQYELDEHNIIFTPEASREDSFLIIGAVTLFTVLFFTLLLGGFILLNRSIRPEIMATFLPKLEPDQQL